MNSDEQPGPDYYPEDGCPRCNHEQTTHKWTAEYLFCPACDDYCYLAPRVKGAKDRMEFLRSAIGH